VAAGGQCPATALPTAAPGVEPGAADRNG